MEDIIESLIFQIEKNNKNVTDDTLFSYIDNNIDDWGIDIGERFLDDVVAQMIYIVKKRNKLLSGKGEAIDFKMDEEYQEQILVSKVSKQYNKIYKSTCKIVINETHDEVEVEAESETKVGSWGDTLNRIDAIYKKTDFL